MFSKLYISIHILVPFCIFELPTLLAIEGKHELFSVGWHVRCKLQPNAYVCHNDSIYHSFYFDSTMQTCLTFEDGQCDLNFNAYYTLRQCTDMCNVPGRQVLTAEELKPLSMDTQCRLQRDFGTCFSYQPSWYFDVSTRLCKSFSYSGCGGNGNRFTSAAACINTCAHAVGPYEKAKIKLTKRV